ncbi:MAG: hypothetical protein EA375_01820 [Acholeplasmataceae bacterium]|nr:MAG: hypothetical protein EA375_01820 [Acholeplasmataceae bacterium]
MKKENLFLLVNTIILLGISLLIVLVITPSVTRETKDKLFGQTITLSALDEESFITEIPEQGNYRIIRSVQTAYDRSGQAIGKVYTVMIKNDFIFDYETDTYGYIELLVGIRDEKVYVEIVHLRQTKAYLPDIQAYIYTAFDGVHYLDVEHIPEVLDSADLEAGATSQSNHAIKDVVWRTVKLHFEIEDPIDDTDPFEELFLEDFGYSALDEDFVPTAIVLAKYDIYDEEEGLLGHVYQLYKFGTYNDAGSSGSITIYVALDPDGIILGYLSPTDEYNHTGGAYRGRVLIYLGSIIGNHISDYDDDADIRADATYSIQLIDDMLNALKGVFMG